MLSIRFPSLLSDLRKFQHGLMPVFFEPMGTGALVLRLRKEAILAARITNEIRIYLFSNSQGPSTHLGLVTAFSDDKYEPMIIATPLFSGDELLIDMVSLLSQAELDLYFFDEHNQEWMGVQAINSDVDRCRIELASATSLHST